MVDIDYSYLRPKKAAALKQWYDAPVKPVESPALWQGEAATILPLRPQPGLLFGRGGVVDSSGAYVPLSAIPGRVDGAYLFEHPDYQDKKVVYCGYLVNHWGHFLIEAVTRLWYFLEKDESVDRYVFFLAEGEARQIQGNYREFFQLLNIWDKLEFINRPTTYRQVLVPELGIHMRTSYVPKFLEVFDTIADNVRPEPNWDTPEKIYFTRSQFSKAQQFETGLDLLDNLFEKNGYTILAPEKLSLSRLIHYIRGAKVVASVSGTLPHNMLFARRSQKLQILERTVISVDNQVDINQMRRLQALHIDANIPLYTIDYAGPFIMGYTPQLERFVRDNGFVPPDRRFLTESYSKGCFLRYMKAYEDLYNYNWFMADWYAPFAESLVEGFRAGQAVFGDYLNRKRPFRWYHYFQLHYWKQFVKRLLGRS